MDVTSTLRLIADHIDNCEENGTLAFIDVDAISDRITDALIELKDEVEADRVVAHHPFEEDEEDDHEMDEVVVDEP